MTMRRTSGKSVLSLHPKQMEVFRSRARFRVVVAGRRWGKCGKKGSLIAMSDGTYKKIEDVKAGDLVLTINEDTYALESKPVQHLHENGVKETLRITTRSGKQLTITPNHPLLANNIWTEAKDLKVGDLVATPKVTVFGDQVMPDHEITILAIWLAEGDIGGFTNQTPEIVQTMKDACAKVGTEFRDGDKRRPGLSWRWRGTTLNKNGAIELLKRYNLRKAKAKTKWIPDEIFKLPKQQLAHFLNLFVATDGCVCRRSKNTWAMEIGLANERMLRQLADLFAKFGIRGNIRKKVHAAKSSVTGEQFVSWRFIVSDSRSLAIFCNEIGALSKEAQVDAALKACLESSGSVNSYLPIAYDDFVKQLAYRPEPKRKYGGYNALVARDMPAELQQSLNSWRKQDKSRISERRYIELSKFSHGYFDPLAQGSFAWDEVISVEADGLHETFDLTVEDNHNFVAEGLVTHNTALSRVLMITRAAMKAKQKVWYVAPSYRMAKQIMWLDLQDAIPKKWIKKINETTLTITLVNGSRLELKGADKPDSLRGVGIHFLVLDEFQDISEETWTKVLRPTLADTRGEAIFIGTPKAYNYLYTLYKHGKDPKKLASFEWESWQFPTITSPFIPVSEIEAARRDMDEKTFAQEFNASFETMSGRVYHAFDRATHIGKYPFNPKLPLWVGMDFNIDPMSVVLLQPQASGEIWAVGEIVLFGSNTEEIGDEIERRFWRYKPQMTIYPDPAGGSRQHARGESDVDILREKGFKKIKFRRKHPAVSDRVNSVNRMLKAADGTVRLRIDESCRHLTNSLEQTIYEKGSRNVDKDAGTEHSADALGYPIELEYPVRKILIGGRSI